MEQWFLDFGNTLQENGRFSKKTYAKYFLFGLLLSSFCFLSCDKKNENHMQNSFVTIQFDTIDGETIESVRISIGEKIPLPNDPTKEAFIFDGWYTDRWYSSSPWDPDTLVVENTILFAKWTEIFDDPKPEPITFCRDDHIWRVQLPWNYDKPYNRIREYPIIIGLHGATSSHDTYYAPLVFNDPQEMQEYPCFVLAPSEEDGWGSSAGWVRDLIEEMKSCYRIDENRIYVVGFSMGGSGSYLFANSYYDEYGQIVAGIVRLAGQSQTVVHDAIAERFAIWYHIGLDDSSVRVRVAREAYKNLKKHISNFFANEHIEKSRITGHRRRTRSLELNGHERVKLSEYKNVGHSPSEPFRDPDVVRWLFSQSLERRPLPSE